jgi:hypothetical protein
MSAIETLLAGLIDYAGLYPPAALDMRTAVRNYLAYQAGRHAFALGRFIVDATRLDEVRDVAGESLPGMPLSVIVASDLSGKTIEGALHRGFRVESVETRCSDPLAIRRFSEELPLSIDCYFELPIAAACSDAIDAVGSRGAFAKLRMGGVVQDAFPAPDRVAACLQMLAECQVPFKATAGLHHPIRSRRRVSYESDSPSAMMHGFVNLFCAAALARDFDGEQVDTVLAEEDAAAFRFETDSIGWRSNKSTEEQVSTIRREFFKSFGSCSFEEPMQDLEALGWL